MQVSHTIDLPLAPEVVFAYITALENERCWQPEIERIRLLTPGPLALGAEFEEVRRSFGRQYTWRFCVTEFEPPWRFAIASIQGKPRYSGSRVCSLTPTGTRLTEAGELETPGWLRFCDPLLARLAQRSQKEAFGRLRALLLQQAAASAGYEIPPAR
ncbi:MAG TPA: SRPBCC family protein [Caldilineaceae bacterium]|nr:SRPBCC family protein [Caldilineaceae bacterium]